MTEIKTGTIKAYLKGHVQALKGAPRWRDFYQWQLDNGKMVPILSWKELPPVARKAVEGWLKRNQVQHKMCYQNAYSLCDQLPGSFGYVEGWAHSGIIPLEHGWNTYTAPDGKVYHFDLTAEVLFKKHFGKKYLAVVELDHSELLVKTLKYRQIGEFMGHIYREGLAKTAS